MGAARLRSGPPPDPNSLNRERDVAKANAAGWTTLPADGRFGYPPPWPLVDQNDREMLLWAIFWCKPQAILWERNAQVYEVALHIRCFAEAELPGATTSIRTLVRQQADALLLTMPALLAARVRIAEAVTDRPDAATAPPRESSRTRLRAVDGEGA